MSKPSHRRRLAAAAVAMQLTAALAAPSLARAQTEAEEWVIRVGGDARRTGSSRTAEGVATLEEALERARVLRNENAARRLTVEMSPGVHRLRSPVRLGPDDSGQPGRPLVIRAAPAGGARLVGSAPLPAAEVATPEALGKFPPEARPHIRAYRLPPALKAAPVDIHRRLNDAPTAMPFEIFDRVGALRPARWPNEGFSTGTSIAGEDRSLIAQPARAARWAGEPELWLSGFMHWDWGYETTRISRLDPGAGRVGLPQAPQFGFRKEPRIAVHHAAAELDQPGEWYRDAAAGIVFVWPREGAAELEVSIAESLLVVDQAAHIRIENLAFERVRGDAIRIHRSRDVVVERSTIRWAGARGILVEESWASGIARSRITDTGEGGITLSGGDRQRLTGASLFVTDTRFERFARLGLAARPAVRLAGVGNRMVGNFIADAAQLAVLFTGNEHLIELNEITRVLVDTSDSGAIYTFRDWTAQGTVVRHNYLHGLHAR
ncbi:MAG TPA: right-handed parallel beta-helix repeat-containing protein, partial [Hyphomicrobiaceae bacterium]|nr:right-handed parallel beta-helix repeat-containing protein [Hyphomicrobiaceae bacterium]